MIRGLVLTDDPVGESHIDYRTKWYEIVEPIAIQIGAEVMDWPEYNEGLEEVTIIYEERIDEVEFVNCPHCHGKLRKVDDAYDYQYSCTRCSRGWRVEEDKSWQALFDAASVKYSYEQVVADQPHKELARFRLDITDVKNLYKTLSEGLK